MMSRSKHLWLWSLWMFKMKITAIFTLIHMKCQKISCTLASERLLLVEFNSKMNNKMDEVFFFVQSFATTNLHSLRFKKYNCFWKLGIFELMMLHHCWCVITMTYAYEMYFTAIVLFCFASIQSCLFFRDKWEHSSLDWLNHVSFCSSHSFQLDDVCKTFVPNFLVHFFLANWSFWPNLLNEEKKNTTENASILPNLQNHNLRNKFDFM